MAKSNPGPKLDEGAVYKLLHYLLFGLFLANVYVIYTFERDRRPQIVERTLTITTNTVVVVSRAFRPLVMCSYDNKPVIFNGGLTPCAMTDYLIFYHQLQFLRTSIRDYVATVLDVA